MQAYYNLFFTLLEPNLSYNASYSERALEELYATISLTRGWCEKGRKLSLLMLLSTVRFEKLRLKQQFSTENSSTANNLWTIAGYAKYGCVVVGHTDAFPLSVSSQYF